MVIGEVNVQRPRLVASPNYDINTPRRNQDPQPGRPDSVVDLPFPWAMII